MAASNGAGSKLLQVEAFSPYFDAMFTSEMLGKI